MGILVEALPDAGAPQVGVTVTGLSASSESVVSVQVSWDAGVTWTGVRGAQEVAVTGAAFFRDHVPPLNTPATYRLVLHSGTAPTGPLEAAITVPSDTAWIQDPLAPRSAVPVTWRHTLDGIALLSSSAATFTQKQAVDLATTEGARLPVASVGVRQGPSGIPLHLRGMVAEQGALIKALRALLDSAGQLVLRGLPAEIPIDPVAHVIVGDTQSVPVIGGVVGQLTDWRLTATQVRPTTMRIVVPWWTYAQVTALWAPRSYAEAAAARPGTSYIDWSKNPEVP